MRILLSQRCLNRTGSGPRSDPPSRVGFSHARTSSGGRTEVSNVSAGARVARRRTRAVISTAAALTAVAALAAPAGAAVNGTHTVATIPGSATLELSGYSPGAHLTIEARRGTTVIGTAATVALDDGSAGVNPVDCWQGTTSPQ